MKPYGLPERCQGCGQSSRLPVFNFFHFPPASFILLVWEEALQWLSLGGCWQENVSSPVLVPSEEEQQMINSDSRRWAGSSPISRGCKNSHYSVIKKDPSMTCLSQSIKCRPHRKWFFFLILDKKSTRNSFWGKSVLPGKNTGGLQVGNTVAFESVISNLNLSSFSWFFFSLWIQKKKKNQMLVSKATEVYICCCNLLEVLVLPLEAEALRGTGREEKQCEGLEKEICSFIWWCMYREACKHLLRDSLKH